jgi:hypothetical protein
MYLFIIYPFVSIVFIAEVMDYFLYKLIIVLITLTVQVALAVERVPNVQMLSNILGILTSVLVIF